MSTGKSEACCGEFMPHAWKIGVCRNCTASEAEHQLAQLEERLSFATNNPSTRDRVVAEIVASEQSYLNSLQYLIKMYITPLKSPPQDEKNGAPLLTTAEAAALFSNVEVITGLNTNFLAELKERVGPNGTQCVGDLFVKFAPYFKMYTEYVTNYEKVTKLLETLMKRSKFVQFLQTRDHTLVSLLILPIQRIPRYSLLLRELQKRTEATHPDKPNIDRALTQIETVASFINEAVRTRENNEKVLKIQQLFVPSPEAKFVEPGRCFCRQGLLTKVGSKKDEPFDFFLFTDILVYASKRVVDGKLLVERRLNLDETFSIQNIPPGVQAGFAVSQQHQFVIISGVKSFAVYCETEAEKQDWLVDIQEAMEETKAKRQTYGSRVQILIPRGPSNFKKAGSCTKCLLVFGLINRRHHCRACNDTFCSICSSFSAEVSGFDGPVRVCESCFNMAGPATVKKLSPLRFVEERIGALTAPSIPCMGGLLTVANLLMEAREDTPDVMYSMESTIDFATQMDGPRVKRLVQAIQDVQSAAKNARSKANKNYIVRIHLPPESGQSMLGLKASSEDLLWRVKQFVTEKIRLKNKSFPESQTAYHFENFDGNIPEETLTLRDIKSKEAGVRELKLVQGWEPSALQKLLADASPCLTAACFKLYLKLLPEPLIPFSLYQAMLDAFRQSASLDGDQRALALAPVLKQLAPSSEKRVRAVCELLAGATEPNSQMVYAFGPIFMRPRERSSKEPVSLTDVQEAMANAKVVLELVQCLVTYWPEVAKQLEFHPLLQPLSMGILSNSKTATTGFALNTGSSPSFGPSVPDTPTAHSAPALPPRPPETAEEKVNKKEKQMQLEQQKREEEKQRWVKEDERRNLEAQRLQEQARKQDAEFQASLVQPRCTECGEPSHKAGKCRRCQERESTTLGEEEDKFDRNSSCCSSSSSSSSSSNGSSVSSSVSGGSGNRAMNGLKRLIRPQPKKQEPLESMSEILAKHSTVGRISTPWTSASPSSPSAAKDHAARTSKANDWAMLQMQQLFAVMKSYGRLNSEGCHEMTLGELMLQYESLSDTLLSTLQRAKKHGLVTFEEEESNNEATVVALTPGAEAL